MKPAATNQPLNPVIPQTLLAALFAIHTGAMAAPGPEVIIDGLAFPEGPLFVDGRLHWVEYASNKLMRLDGGMPNVLHEQEGCGHNGLALSPDGHLVVICYESGEILYLDVDGNVVERVDSDADGKPFDHPNDIVFTDDGGAYITTSGPFTAESELIVGGVFYRAPGTPVFVEVANDMHFANGIAIIDDGSTLLVSEHNTNRIVRFDIAADGSLSNRRLFVRMSDLVPAPPQPPIWLGPDGMKVDSEGNIFVAHYMGARVVKMSSDGELLQTYDVPGIAVTNVAFAPDGESMYVTAVTDLSAPPFPGGIWKIKL